MNTVQVIYWTISLLLVCVSLWLGPLNAVKTGRKLNNEQQKDNAKRTLFLTLFSLRGNPVHFDFVRGLNQIEVVFEDVPSVISAWRVHFASLGNRDQANKDKNWEIERAALLSAMAVHLGYSNIPHGELLRDYYPEGHDNQFQDDRALRQKWVDYLNTSTLMNQMIIEKMENQPIDSSSNEL